MLATLTLLSIIYWVLMSFNSYRRRLVLHALQLSHDQNIQTSYTAALYFGDEANFETADAFLKEQTGMTLMENFDLFFNDVCSIDVVFVIKLISLNSNSLAFRDILNHLWEIYLDIDTLKIRDVTYRPIITLKRPPAMILGTSESSSTDKTRPRKREIIRENASDHEDTKQFLPNE